MKSSGKFQSISTDTRVSNSNIFNNSYLVNSSGPELNQFMSHKIKESENRQVEFLRQKNSQMNEKIKRIMLNVKELEDSNRTLLEMNRKYVKIVNTYYQNQHKKVNKLQKNQRKHLFQKDLHAQQNINSVNIISNSEAHRLLEQLEKDHRNLVKHCLVMQQEIKNYNEQINHYNEMKDQLHAVNHTNVDQLIKQLHELTNQNKALKKQNNLITYEFEKSKLECNNIKKMNNIKEQQAGSSQSEITKMRSIVNTTKQQCEEKAKGYQARIYELELKVQKLETQLRTGQQNVYRADQQRKGLVMKHIEHIHDYEKLRQNYSQLQRSLYSNQKQQKSYSRNNGKKVSNINRAYDMDNILTKSFVSKPKAKLEKTRLSLMQKSSIN